MHEQGWFQRTVLSTANKQEIQGCLDEVNTIVVTVEFDLHASNHVLSRKIVSRVESLQVCMHEFRDDVKVSLVVSFAGRTLTIILVYYYSHSECRLASSYVICSATYVLYRENSSLTETAS